MNEDDIKDYEETLQFVKENKIEELTNKYFKNVVIDINEYYGGIQMASSPVTSGSSMSLHGVPIIVAPPIDEKAEKIRQLKKTCEEQQILLDLKHVKYNVVRRFLYKLGYKLPLEGKTADEVRDFAYGEGLRSTDPKEETDFEKFAFDIKFIDEEEK